MRFHRLFPIEPKEDAVIIIGAGASGICAAVRLKQEGYRNIQIFEKREKAGGTWFVNKYPGCACDVPGFLYQFSFFSAPFRHLRPTTFQISPIKNIGC